MPDAHAHGGDLADQYPRFHTGATDAHANHYRHSDQYPRFHTGATDVHPDRYRHADQYTHPDADEDADEDADPDGNADEDADPDGNADADTDSDAAADLYPVGHVDAAACVLPIVPVKPYAVYPTTARSTATSTAPHWVPWSSTMSALASLADMPFRYTRSLVIAS